MNQPIASTPVFAGKIQPLSAFAASSLSREEVIPLAREELTRFLAVLEAVSPADWANPTECSLWTVKDIAAHQASHVLALTTVREFINQFNPLNFRAYSQKGMNLLDAANQRQVDKRAEWTSAQVIDEIQAHRESSFLGRQRFPSVLRWIRIGVPGYEGSVSLGELIDSIFTRDMWMHRLDICRATGQEMTQTADHDGRLTTLAMRDLDQHLSAKLNGQTVIYRLTGQAGGEWIVGGNSTASAGITLSVLDFHRLASGRITYQQALQQGLVKIEGDQSLGNLALQHTVVLY